MVEKTPGVPKGGFSGEKVPFEAYLKEHPRVVILHFQPKEISVIESPEELRRWEKLLREQVGLPPLGADVEYTPTGTWCHSGSLPGDGMCVCDEDCEQE